MHTKAVETHLDFGRPTFQEPAFLTLPCPLLLRTISGAMYSMVPQKEKVRSFYGGRAERLKDRTGRGGTGERSRDHG